MMMDVSTGSMKLGASAVVATLLTFSVSSDAFINPYPLNISSLMPAGIHKKYDATTSTLNDGFVGVQFRTEESTFSILSKQFVIDSIDKAYINAFSFALKDLMYLNTLVVEVFGKVNKKIERFYANGTAGLLVKIQGTGDVSDDLNKLQSVCEEWFVNTELDVSKNIYIDIMV